MHNHMDHGQCIHGNFHANYIHLCAQYMCMDDTTKGHCEPILGQIRVGDDGHTLGDNVANCFRTFRPDSDGPENQLS